MCMLVSELVLVPACVRVCGSCVCACVWFMCVCVCAVHVWVRVQVNEGFLSDTKFRFSRHPSILTSQAKHLP